jgi:hypothetical protein
MDVAVAGAQIGSNHLRFPKKEGELVKARSVKDSTSAPKRSRIRGYLLIGLAWGILIGIPAGYLLLIWYLRLQWSGRHGFRLPLRIHVFLVTACCGAALFLLHVVARAAGWPGSDGLGRGLLILLSPRNQLDGLRNLGGWLRGLAGWLFLAGQKAKAVHAKDLVRDDRPPVLLLRAFSDDERAAGTRNYFFGALSTVETFEEIVADTLGAYGPILAIGRPGETTPPLGAARMWVSDKNWKARVINLLHECQLVVMAMGEFSPGDGLSWEVEQIVAHGFLQKAVLVMPPCDEAEAFLRWESYRRVLVGRMPLAQGGELVATFNNGTACQVYRVGWGVVTAEQKNRHSYTTLLTRAVKKNLAARRRAADRAPSDPQRGAAADGSHATGYTEYYK